ncbi:hypothetical protein M9458_023270, partial [Cirrhinus mrigala]
HPGATPLCTALGGNVGFVGHSYSTTPTSRDSGAHRFHHITPHIFSRPGAHTVSSRGLQ